MRITIKPLKIISSHSKHPSMDFERSLILPSAIPTGSRTRMYIHISYVYISVHKMQIYILHIR